MREKEKSGRKIETERPWSDANAFWLLRMHFEGTNLNKMVYKLSMEITPSSSRLLGQTCFNVDKLFD